MIALDAPVTDFSTNIFLMQTKQRVRQRVMHFENTLFSWFALERKSTKT